MKKAIILTYISNVMSLKQLSHLWVKNIATPPKGGVWTQSKNSSYKIVAIATKPDHPALRRGDI